MRNLTALIALAAAVTLVAPGCSKKKKDEKKSPAAAGKKGADKAVAAGKGAAKKIAEKVKPKAPPPADVKLDAGDSVVAWLSFRSLTAVFDASETIASQIGVVPPGASLRDSFYRDLTRALADQGITGHEWLDKAKPVHLFLQDDNPQDLPGGVVVMLPMTDKAKAEASLKTAIKGAEAKGHAALLKPVRPGPKAQPIAGAPDVFIDFIGKYMVVTSKNERFGKAKAFATRLSATTPPSLAYLGVSVTDAAKTRKPQIEMLLAQFARMEATQAQAGMPAGYYSKMFRQWVTDMTRLELTVDGDTNYVKIGGRVQAAAGSKLAKQLNAGKGRDARPSGDSLPGNSFLSFVADMDPKAGISQLDQTMKMLKTMFKLDEKVAADLDADLRAVVNLQTGQSGLAMYRDGPSAAGALTWYGATDPVASIKALKDIVAEIGIKAIAQEKAKKGKALSKAEEAQFAVVERALKERKLEPLLTTYGPMAKEMGITITQNASKDGGAACEVVDFALDWTKIAKPGDKEAAAAKAVIGDRTAVALCSAKNRVALAVGPSALEQGRRSALGKKGGLVDAPVYKAAAERVEGTPSSFFYLNLGAAVAAFKAVVPPIPVRFPADRPVTLNCGNRAQSYACGMSVPVGAIGAILTLTRGK